MVRRIAWILALAGALPFVAATTALYLSEAASVRVPAIAALVTYAAVILSFLGGVEWGVALREESGNEATRAVALALSTLPSLAAWGVLWLPSAGWQLGGSLAVLIGVWAADQWLASRGLLPSWFVDLRTAATALVALILAAALLRV